jgi:hypothetical protein
VLTAHAQPGPGDNLSMDTTALPETFEPSPVRPNWEQRERNGNVKPEAADRCQFCNRPMADYDGDAAQIHLDGSNGEYFRVDLELETDSRSQGWFSIGSACAKKVPRAYVSFPEKS